MKHNDLLTEDNSRKEENMKEENIATYLSLAQWVEKIPELQGKQFNVDFNTGDPIEFRLGIPTQVPDKSGVPDGADDILGNGFKQMVFDISSTEIWSDDILRNIDNLEYLKKINKSVRKLNREKIYPNLGENIEVTKVVATTDPSLREGRPNNVGIYTIDFMIDYTEKVQPNENKKFNIPHRW